MLNKLVKVCGAITVNCGLHNSHSCDVPVLEFGSTVGYRQKRAGLHLFLHELSDRGESNEHDVSVLLIDLDQAPLAIH